MMRNAFYQPLAAIGAVLLLCAWPAVAETPSPASAPVGAVSVDACASDPTRLGLSRIVEIDTERGPQFGGSHGAETAFLKDHEVVLTFDDGPLRPYTRPVLKALAEHCTKATFFMVGRMAAADPAMVKEVAAGGHTIGSHTWSHQNLKAIGMFKGRSELESGVSAVTKALGAPIAPFFRFPFLSGSRPVEDYAKTRNIATFWIDVDSKDYLTRDPNVVHARIMSLLSEQRKGIILMHDLQPSTAKAIMGLLNELRDKGYKVVHMVPKTQGNTIATFDGAAEKALAAKSKADAANPLASRSMVWTMAPAATGSTSDAATAKAPAPPTSKAAAEATEEVLPWLPSASKKSIDPPAAAPAATPKKPPRKAEDDPPWFPKIFNY